MAFALSGLSRGYQVGAGVTQWTYKTADTLATVDTAGYFNAVADRLKVGDCIFAFTSTGPAAGHTIVLSNTRDLAAVPAVEGVVDVADFTAVQDDTDTD